MALQVTVLMAALLSGFFGMFLLLEFVTLNTSIQMVVPDAFRGRVLSLYMLGLLGLRAVWRAGAGRDCQYRRHRSRA